MGYTSIFGPSAPSQTTLPGRGYTSIFTPTAHVKAANTAVDIGKSQIQQQLKQQFHQDPSKISTTPELKDAFKNNAITHDQFTQRFAQIQNEPTRMNKYSPSNIAGAVGQGLAKTGEGVVQGVTRAVPELVASARGKTITTPQKGIGGVLLGKSPITPLQQQGEQTAASHPKGFNIGPLHLNPAQAGVGLAAAKGAADLSVVLPAAKAASTAAKTAVGADTAANLAAKETVGNAARQNVLKTTERVPAKSTPVKPELAPETKLGSTSAVPKTKTAPNEAGAVAPGQAVKDVQDLLQKHQASSKFAGNLEEDHAKLEGSKKVIAEDAAKVIQNRAPLANSDKQILQDYRDTKAAGLTPKALPEHLQAEDTATTALNKAAQSHDAELARLNGQESKAQTIEARNPETYTHREAQNKGGALDYLVQGDRKNPLSVGGLSKSTPSGKARSLMSVTDEQGNRRVVSIKNRTLKDEQGNKIAQGKLVQAIDQGGKESENLGRLNLKSNQDFLDKELQPYQTKIKNLQKEGDALAKVKTKGGVSDARINSLAQKVGLLEDPGNMTALTKSEAKSLRDAKLKLQELTKVKEPGTNATGRLQTINRHLIDMNNKIAEIHDKYNPETLDKKVFVGKDGKNYTIGQATTSEITKATGQKYYIDPKLLALKNYAESRTALENARFIDSIKTHPDFEDFASPKGQTAPKGWKEVDLPQFQGYKFEPKTAEVLNDIAKRGGEKGILDKVGNVLKQTIVYFPLKHSLNEGVTYAVDRGLSSLVNPMAYKRGAESLVEAFHEVTNQGPKFQAAQKAGLHTVTGGDEALNKAFSREIKNLAGNEKLIGDTAKQWGTSPVRLYKAVQNLTVWQLQDMLNMARVIERTKPKLIGKGEDLESAVKNTQKFNLQYSVPSRVGPKILPGAARRGLANTLKSPKIFFGRYRYDLYRILSNTIKDTVNLKTLAKGGKQNAQAVDKLAAMALGAAVLWPLVDKGIIQKISGNKNAYMKAPGVLELPAEGLAVAKGKKSVTTVAGGQLFVSGAVTLPLDLKNNLNSFTGKHIYDPNAPPSDQFKSIMQWAYGQATPVQQNNQAKGAGGNRIVNTLLSLASVRFPKNAPETNGLNSLKYDSLPNVQKQAKGLVANGDSDGAIKAIRDYDNQVLKATKKALESAGMPIPDDKTLIGHLKAQQYYYDPTLKTLNSWKTQKTSQGTLQDLLNATQAPKKGEPGYLQYRQQQKAKSFTSRFNKSQNQPVIP